MISNVAILGSGSLLAEKLKNRLENDGLRVFQFTHSLQNQSQSELIFDIHTPVFNPNFKLDTILYFSWLPNRDDLSQSESCYAANLVSQWANENHVKFIFISSMAASINQPSSNYGYWKKAAEHKVLDRQQYVVRPGTVLSDVSEYGSSVTKLNALPTASKWIISWFTKLSFPTVNEEYLLDRLTKIAVSQEITLLHEIVTNTNSLQEALGVKSGLIPLKIVKILSNFLPIETRDPLKTLVDLS